MQRVKGAVRVEVRSGGSQESRGTAGQIGELVPNGRRRNVVELRGGLVAKPADMFLPDGANDPRDPTVTLGKI